MLIYEGTKDNFLTSVEQDTIAVEIENNIYERMHRHTAKNEFRAWENSMEYMYKVLNDQDIPSDAGIAIEYNIPQTSKRVDFLISGYGKQEDANVVLIELKQWDELEAVPGRDGLVQTYTGNAVRQVVHPSYQAWSYAMLISDYNASVQEGMISIFPCAYLHNYRRHKQDPIDAEQYEIYLEDAPAFTRGEVTKLRNFIKKSIRLGDNKELIYKIDSGRIKPSKSLQDSISKMLKGNREFIMLDEQKVVYEEILDEARMSAKDGNKRVVIVKGGPGTGKSVVAVNLLAELTKEDQFCQYVSKNSAPRNVYRKKLKGSIRKSSVDNMFKGSGIYTETDNNMVDTVLVDESHRLNEKSGMFHNMGENQIKEIIHAAKCSVFFIDESQRVTLQDIGSVDEIRKWAEEENAQITEMELVSQFRCNGSDGYLAGYCWNWKKEGVNDPSVHDIKIGDFEISWNLKNTTTYLPERGFTDEEAELIFAHELHHIRRRDTHMKFFLRFCCAFGWIHPLVWVAVRKAEDDLELSCDEIVLKDADKDKRRRYAELLLSIAGDSRGYSTCLSASAKSLRYRLRAALPVKNKRKGVLLLFLIMIVCGLCTGRLALSTNRGTLSELAGPDTAEISNADFQSGRYADPHGIKDVELLSQYLSDLQVERIYTGYENDSSEGGLTGEFATAKRSFVLSGNYLHITDIVSGETEKYYIRIAPDWEFVKSLQ